MKNKKLIFILLLFFALVACRSKGNQIVQETTEADGVVQVPPIEVIEDPTPINPLPADSSVWYEGEKPFVFDYHKNYPITDIRLSELADVSYLPLEKNDTFSLRLRGQCEGNEYYLTQDCIYMQDESYTLYTYGRDGRFIRRFEQRGSGPGEYNFIGSFAVDEYRKEIFIQDGTYQKERTLVYSLGGQFLRSFPTLVHEICSLNDSLLIGYNDYSWTDYPYYVIRKNDGHIVKRLPIKQVDKKYVSTERMAYGSLTTTARGVLLGSLANDTIFELRKDLTIAPRIVDKSDYGTYYAQAHPTIETPRYLMFYTLVGQNYAAKVKERFYIYDKKECRIYQMKEHKDNAYWRLLDDYPHVTNWNKTQNPQVAVRSRLARSLMQGKGKHGPAELQELLKTLNENDNPVLEIMMFHGVDKIANN